MIYYCMKMLKTKQMWLEQTTYFSTNECISLIIKIDIVLYLHKCKPLPIKIRHLAIYSTESAIRDQHSEIETKER